MQQITHRSDPYRNPPPAPLIFGKTPTEFKRTVYKVGVAFHAAAIVGVLWKGEGSDKALALLPATVAGGLMHCLSNLKDYHNPEELQTMRTEAQELSFFAVEKKHGLRNMKFVLPQDLMQQKFADAHESYTLSQLLAAYPLDRIKTHDLATPNTLRGFALFELLQIPVQNLKDEFVTMCGKEKLLEPVERDLLTCTIAGVQTVNTTWKAACRDSDLKYPKRMSKLLEELNQKERSAPEEARKLRESIIANGNAAASDQANARLLVDAVLTDKRPGTLLVENIDRRQQGRNVADDAARLTEQQYLERALIAIRAQHYLVLEKKIGEDDEISYREEIAEADTAYHLKIAHLQTTLREAVQTWPLARK